MLNYNRCHQSIGCTKYTKGRTAPRTRPSMQLWVTAHTVHTGKLNAGHSVHAIRAWGAFTMIPKSGYSVQQSVQNRARYVALAPFWRQSLYEKRSVALACFWRQADRSLTTQWNRTDRLDSSTSLSSTSLVGTPHRDGKGSSAVHVLQSMTALPLLHWRVHTPAASETQSPVGVPACNRNMSCQFLSSDSQP